MRIRTILLAMVAAASFAVTACNGNGGDDAGDGGDTVSDTAPQDTDEMDTADDTETEDTENDSGMDTVADSGDTTTMDSDPGDTGADTMDGNGQPTGISVRELRNRISLNPGDSASNPYKVTDVIVTGIAADGAGSGFFIQDNSGAKENSGLWVFTGNNQLSGSLPTINQGTVLEITGTVTNYDNMGNSSQGGLLELEKITDIAVLNQGATLPNPVSVNASEIALSGSKSETYEGVLVEVTNVTVKNGPNMFDDTELQSGLYIGPELYNYKNDYSPTANDTYSSIVGPLNFSFDQTEISPRSSSDITK